MPIETHVVTAAHPPGSVLPRVNCRFPRRPCREEVIASHPQGCWGPSGDKGLRGSRSILYNCAGPPGRGTWGAPEDCRAPQSSTVPPWPLALAGQGDAFQAMVCCPCEVHLCDYDVPSSLPPGFGVSVLPPPLGPGILLMLFLQRGHPIPPWLCDAWVSLWLKTQSVTVPKGLSLLCHTNLSRQKGAQISRIHTEGSSCQLKQKTMRLLLRTEATPEAREKGQEADDTATEAPMRTSTSDKGQKDFQREGAG